MKERPILFSATMVHALLNGTKTQTRRVVKKSDQWPINTVKAVMLETRGTAMAVDAHRCTYGPEIKCPYGQPGDRLWVRETFQGPFSWGVWDGKFAYKSDPENLWPENIRSPNAAFWKPSIHMPRKASRITLDVTGVRVERLNNISGNDAQAEGIVPAGDGNWHLADTRHYMDHPIESYASLWEYINGAGSWAANPWVWVIEFKRVTP